MGNSTSTSISADASYIDNALQSQEEETSTTTNQLTPNEKLLLEYDKMFNKTNRNFNSKKREIQTKTRLIQMNSGADEKKRDTIVILQHVFLFLILAFFVIWFHVSGLINLVGTVVIMAIVLVGVIYKYFKNRVVDMETTIAVASSQTGDDLRKTFEEAYLSMTGTSGYTCQEYCPPEESEESTAISGPIVTNTRPRYLRQDSQRDVWLKGDQPSNTYTYDDANKRYRIDGELVKGFGYDKNLYISPSGIPKYRSTLSELEDSRPQREIIPISKKYATYYNCKFLGGTGSEQKVPYKSSYDYTTIPCDNYPGFVETKRMICPSDPKTNGTSQCKVVSSSS